MKIPQEAVPTELLPSLPVLRRHRVGTIEISASRWSPVINRIVSDPLDQPPANRYLGRSVQGGSHANSRVSWEKKVLLPVASFAFSPPFLASLATSFFVQRTSEVAAGIEDRSKVDPIDDSPDTFIFATRRRFSSTRRKCQWSFV